MGGTIYLIGDASKQVWYYPKSVTRDIMGQILKGQPDIVLVIPGINGVKE